MNGSRWMSAMVVGVAIFTMVSSSRAEDYTAYHWALDILPASLGISLDGDRFNAKGIDRSIPEIPTLDKESVSLLDSVPTLALAVGIEKQNFMLDLRGGGGALLNQQMWSPMFFGTAGILFELQRAVWVGPHAGWAWYVDPEWWGDADVDFDSTDGLIAGLSFIAGDRISYMLAIDYYAAEFDVERVGPEWEVSDDKADLSNLSVQFGVRAEF